MKITSVYSESGRMEALPEAARLADIYASKIDNTVPERYDFVVVT
jgi:hypothetical protein